MSGNIPVFNFIGGGIKTIHLQLLRLFTLGFLKVLCKNKIENSIEDKQFKKRLHKLYRHRS